MYDDHWVLESLRSLLPEARISYRHNSKLLNFRPDFEAEIILQNQRLILLGEMIRYESRAVFSRKCENLKKQAALRPDIEAFIAAPYLSPEKQKECRERGVFFMDRSGNAYIRSGSIYIDKSGLPNLFPEKRKGRGIFSDKASLLLREMLLESRFRGVRDLAASLGLDPGYVSRLIKELECAGHLLRKDGRFKLMAKKSLLEDWAHIYDFRRNQESLFFCPEESPQKIIKKLEEVHFAEDADYALTCQAGAFLVSPHARFDRVHIYVPDHSSIDIFVAALSLVEAPQGANLVLLDPYYRYSFKWRSRQVRNLRVVSDLQLYLDLFSYPLRGIEQAEFLYERRLRALIEGD